MQGISSWIIGSHVSDHWCYWWLGELLSVVLCIISQMSFQFQTICMTFIVVKSPWPACVLCDDDRFDILSYMSVWGRSFHIITMTSQWARLRLNSTAPRLFTQLFIQAEIKENIKAPRHWPLCGEFTGTGEFPTQMASNAENVYIWWRHHVQVRSLCYLFHRYPSMYITSLGGYWYYWTWLENAQQVKWPYTCSPAPL